MEGTAGESATFVPVTNKHALAEVTLALAAGRGNQVHPSGTATIIGYRLAITAKHVIDDYWNAFEWKKIVEPPLGTPSDKTTSYTVIAVNNVPKIDEIALWYVTKVWCSNFTDIALLYFQPGSPAALQHDWKFPVLNVLPPKEGSLVTGFGYQSSQIEIEEMDGGIGIDWNNVPTVTTGRVVEVHKQRRDTGMLNFPCFRVNARFDGGMSGGPVFNEAGELCGVICSGYPPIEDQEHVSYAASLCPLMGTMLSYDPAGKRTDTSYLTAELATQGRITTRNLEKLRFIENEDGHIFRIDVLK